MSLLLVNRQFRDEYTERCEDQQTLFLHDAFKSLDKRSILNELEMLKGWVTGICYFASATEPTALRELEGFLGNCAHWYKDLPAVNVRLYFSHRQDSDNYTPNVFKCLQNTIVEITSFQKIAELEVYATKRARRGTSITRSRKLLARWCRGDSPSDMFLDRAPHGGKIEWEIYSKTSLEDDDSASSCESSTSWSKDEGDDCKDHSSVWGDDGGNNDFSHLEPHRGKSKYSDLVFNEDSQDSRGADDSADNDGDKEGMNGNAGTGDPRSDRKPGSDAMKRVRQWLALASEESSLSGGLQMEHHCAIRFDYQQ